MTDAEFWDAAFVAVIAKLGSLEHGMECAAKLADQALAERCERRRLEWTQVDNVRRLEAKR